MSVGEWARAENVEASGHERRGEQRVRMRRRVLVSPTSSHASEHAVLDEAEDGTHLEAVVLLAVHRLAYLVDDHVHVVVGHREAHHQHLALQKRLVQQAAQRAPRVLVPVRRQRRG